MWAYQAQCRSCVAVQPLLSKNEADADKEVEGLGWKVDRSKLTDLYDIPIGDTVLLTCPRCRKKLHTG